VNCPTLQEAPRAAERTLFDTMASVQNFRNQRSKSQDIARVAPGTTWIGTSNKYDFVLN
jgi:hypothetical protein